jgi:hypothetical protein
MSMPTKAIVDRLKSKNFMKQHNGNLVPCSITKFLPLPVKDIIIRFRVILNGYLNYFSFIDNPSGLLKIY